MKGPLADSDRLRVCVSGHAQLSPAATFPTRGFKFVALIDESVEGVVIESQPVHEVVKAFASKGKLLF